ncbi:ABC transporter permease [Propionibacterium sp.]|uniref:ABC transporter permease n=1 Tax=Propionibacterium sp. TaxID=1977903 RepID=UPI0039EBD49C
MQTTDIAVVSGNATVPLRAPGHGHGLLDVFRSRFLLRRIVNKEIQVRYRDSILGLLWSYIKPAVQFGVFYLAMGVFLGLNKGLENYAIYMFSGIVVMNLFGEVFTNASRSIVGNGGLIKKIYLPRELFPVSSLWVAWIHFLPQVAILVAVNLFVGWHPTWIQLGSFLVASFIVSVFALALGLIFGAADVFFRDAENFVDLINMVATWLSPVLYMWVLVENSLGSLAMTVYMFNPLTVAVELFHDCFWAPTTTRPINPEQWRVVPHLFSVWTPIAVLISVLMLVLGDFIFRRVERQFAQEL